jgi:phenylacetate-CoA ligase
VVLEVVDDFGRQVAPGQMGRVLMTTLHNRLMPLIRYEIGDYAVAASGACSCGRTLPLLGPIAGREINLFIDGEGKKVVPWALFRPLTARHWVRQYQVIQRQVGRFVVRFVGDRLMGSDDEAEIRRHFEALLRSRVAIEFERVEQIPRAPSGKFMMAMCEVGGAAAPGQCRED